MGVEPAAAGVEEQGFGWKNKCGAGNAGDTISSGLEGAWTSAPTMWTTQYLDNLFMFEWEQTKSPAGAVQWIPKDGQAANLVPDAHDPEKRHAPIMFTTDLSLKFDPEYRKIALRFQENPEEFERAFSRAWFKLTHRDMGPRARYLGSMVPQEVLMWQDPIPVADYQMINAADIRQLKNNIIASGLSETDLIKTAWASAASFRSTDMRGGVNGARIRLAPQKNWDANDPVDLARVLTRLEEVQSEFNGAQSGNKQVSLADLIVLGGNTAIEQAAKKAGRTVSIPFTPGRTDASAAQTDAASFAVLEPTADGFRNYFNPNEGPSPAEMLVDRANMLSLSIPEMTALVGGMRALNANTGGSQNGVLTTRPGTLSNDFFVNLLDMSTEWEKSTSLDGVYVGRDRQTGDQKWTATPVDLIFGSNSELRAVSEVYAASDGEERFTRDFVDAWTKVMNLDRFDLQ